MKRFRFVKHTFTVGCLLLAFCLIFSACRPAADNPGAESSDKRSVDRRRKRFLRNLFGL